MRLVDLSPSIAPTTPGWPGDARYARELRWSVAEGDSVTVATFTTSGHIGSHVDAPKHVREQGAAIEDVSIEHCIGPCLVLDVADLVDAGQQPHGHASFQAIRKRIQAISGDAVVERILLRHYRDSREGWDDHMPGLDPDFVTWFGAQGGKLIGVDLDSFDPMHSTELPAHHAAIDAGIVMLEGLALSAAPQGLAELFAPPVRWEGADAAPVRAVLRVAGEPNASAVLSERP